MRILFINHNAERCGVADYGKRLFDILKKSIDITYCDTAPDLTGYDIALYNYHYATQPNVDTSNKSVKHVALFHEAFLNAEFDKVINVADLPRPLFEGLTLPQVENKIPVIGSFGFGFPDKNFPGLCKKVAEQYENACIRLNIPFAQFGDNIGDLAKGEVNKCNQVLIGSKIILEVNHKFLSHHELLNWLNANDVNIFYYNQSSGRGISSSTDYALSVKKPIGVSSSEMFRHLPSEICIDNTRIQDLNTSQLNAAYEDNSNINLVNKVTDLLK